MQAGAFPTKAPRLWRRLSATSRFDAGRGTGGQKFFTLRDGGGLSARVTQISRRAADLGRKWTMAQCTVRNSDPSGARHKAAPRNATFDLRRRKDIERACLQLGTTRAFDPDRPKRQEYPDDGLWANVHGI